MKKNSDVEVSTDLKQAPRVLIREYLLHNDKLLCRLIVAPDEARAFAKLPHLLNIYQLLKMGLHLEPWMMPSGPT